MIDKLKDKRCIPVVMPFLDALLVLDMSVVSGQ